MVILPCLFHLVLLSVTTRALEAVQKTLGELEWCWLLVNATA